MRQATFFLSEQNVSHRHYVKLLKLKDHYILMSSCVTTYSFVKLSHMSLNIKKAFVYNV